MGYSKVLQFLIWRRRGLECVKTALRSMFMALQINTARSEPIGKPRSCIIFSLLLFASDAPAGVFTPSLRRRSGGVHNRARGPKA